jgi:protein-L-isoaspartate(D-aspartate) O-methyltransferase
MARKAALFCLACFAFVNAAAAEDSQFDRKRELMVETIRAHARGYGDVLGKDGIAETVLTVIGQTKRHLFIPKPRRYMAYADTPVSIGHGQTISQPFIVALMTHLAAIRSDHTVLEIGTGSGYQAAILARLAGKVCTIEIVRPLGEAAAKLLMDLGYRNVSVRIGDGYKGWPACGPFDAIVVTAALGHVPPPLIEQLKTGGRLVMPVGAAGATQKLAVVEKTAPGKTRTHFVGFVRFVPFTRPRK